MRRDCCLVRRTDYYLVPYRIESEISRKTFGRHCYPRNLAVTSYTSVATKRNFYVNKVTLLTDT
jgi:hypothetical protein